MSRNFQPCQIVWAKCTCQSVLWMADTSESSVITQPVRWESNKNSVVDVPKPTENT
jgi:hypothetical protein